MKITFEINEAENEGKGKVTIHYKVGVSEHTMTKQLGENDISAFAYILGRVKEHMWRDKEGQIRGNVKRLADLFEITKDEEPR